MTIRKRYLRTYQRMLRMMVRHHDSGTEYLDTEFLYQWFNAQTKHGVTMNQLTNIIGKSSHIDRAPWNTEPVYGIQGGRKYSLALWCVHPHHREAFRAKKETKNDED